MWPVTRPKDCFVQTSESQDRRRRYLSPVEAAHFLGGLNSRTVVRWAREGYLPSYPLGEGKRRRWVNIWSAGHGVGAVRDIPTTAELCARLQAEYRASIRSLAAEIA